MYKERGGRQTKELLESHCDNYLGSSLHKVGKVLPD